MSWSSALGERRNAVSEQLISPAIACISSEVRASASETTAAGFPANFVAVNASTEWLPL
jgi:hypothetical protein